MRMCFIDKERDCVSECTAAYSPSNGKISGDYQCRLVDTAKTMQVLCAFALEDLVSERKKANFRTVHPDSAAPPETKT